MKRVRRQTNTEWRAVYHAFLQSPEWASKRARVLSRAGHRCEACLRATATEVHHTSYPMPLTLSKLAFQPAWQLRAVCGDCHRHLHKEPSE